MPVVPVKFDPRFFVFIVVVVGFTVRVGVIRGHRHLIAPAVGTGFTEAHHEVYVIIYIAILFDAQRLGRFFGLLGVDLRLRLRGLNNSG